jgi:hypothetical protein
MIRFRFAVCALASLLAGPLYAQTPLVGDWDVTIQSPQGANTVKTSFKQDGEKIDGLFKSPQGELPFTGTMTGNELKFSFTINFQGQPLEIAMTGKLEGDSITGKASFGGMADGDWSAKRAADTVAAAAPPPATETPAAPATTASPSSTMTTIAGKWDVTLLTPGGEFPANATLSEEAGKVSGTFGSQMGEVPVSGTVEGHALTITMTAQTPQGAMNVVLTGEIDGDAIVHGKAEVAGMGQMEWSAKRSKQ